MIELSFTCLIMRYSEFLKKRRVDPRIGEKVLVPYTEEGHIAENRMVTRARP